MSSFNIVPLEELERFFNFIADNNAAARTSFGLELEFFERNGFHWRIGNHLYEDFAWYVDDYVLLSDESFLEGFGARARPYLPLAIQLRNSFRGKFAMAALSNDEIAHFELGAPLPPNLFKWRAAHAPAGGPEHSATLEEQTKAAGYIKAQYPEIVEYISALEHLAPKQGYHHSQVSGYGTVLPYAADGLCAVINQPEEYFRIHGSDGVLQILRNLN